MKFHVSKVLLVFSIIFSIILTPINNKDVFADTNDETGSKGIEIKAFDKANGGT